jgi:protein-tyrosine phosphatase
MNEPGRADNPDRKLVLFICTGNFYRSRFAEALFNHHAEQRELSWRAFSRGLAIHYVGEDEGELSPYTRAALELRGVSLSCTGECRVQLGEDHLESAHRVIILDETEHRPMLAEQFPGWLDRVEWWHVADLHAATVEEALPAIEECVHGLLAGLELERGNDCSASASRS